MRQRYVRCRTETISTVQQYAGFITTLLAMNPTPLIRLALNGLLVCAVLALLALASQA
jgi:hypothetical protein